MNTLKIHHIGYLVKKLESSIRSFEALGYQIVKETVYDEGRDVNICFLSKDGYQIELVTPVSDSSVVAGLLKKYKNCPYHICYACSNFEETLADLTANGYVAIDSPTPAPAIEGRRVVFLMNASLGMIELLDLG